MTYTKSKSYKEAFDSFRKAVRLKSDWPEAQFRLGIMAYVLGKRDTSNDEYRKLLQLASPYANVLYRIIKDDTTATIASAMNDGDEPLGTNSAAETPSSAKPTTSNHTVAPSSTNESVAAKPNVSSTPITNQPVSKAAASDQKS